METLYTLDKKNDMLISEDGKKKLKVGYACWREFPDICGIPLLGKKIDANHILRDDEEIKEARQRYLALPENHKCKKLLCETYTSTVEDFDKWLEKPLHFESEQKRLAIGNGK